MRASDAFGRLVVVGASLAGLRAAETLRREGFAGELTIVGAEEHWPPFDRPPLSKQVLAGAWPEDKARLRVDDDLKAEFLLGRAAAKLDTGEQLIELADGSVVPYDGLIIATGTFPRSLPGVEPGPGVHLLRTIADCRRLSGELDDATRVTIVGAGFIGSEVASTCRSRGLDVTVIEPLPLPLVRVFGPEIGEVCATMMREQGVDLRLGVGVSDVHGSIAVLSNGDEVESDVLVVGIGVAPATAWLESSGLELENGVVCDETLAAVDEGGVAVGNIVAAGDVARWPNQRFGADLVRIEHWTNAAEQGEHAARRLLHGAGAAGAFTPIPYFWSDQFGARMQFIGTNRPDDRFVLAEGDLAGRRFVATYERDGRIVGALCVNRPARTIPWRAYIAGDAPRPELVV